VSAVGEQIEIPGEHHPFGVAPPVATHATLYGREACSTNTSNDHTNVSPSNWFGLRKWLCHLAACFATQQGDDLAIRQSEFVAVRCNGGMPAAKRKGRRPRGDTKVPVPSTGVIRPGRLMTNNRGQVHTTIAYRTVVLSPLTTSTTAAVLINYSFKLSDVLNYTEFTALFDFWRLRTVELTFIPRVDTSIAADVWTDPRLYTIVDFDGSTLTPATFNSFLEYDTCQVHDPRHGFRMKLQPRTTFTATTGTGGLEAAPNTWVDCATPDVQHFGVSAGLLAQNVITVVTVTARYELEFKRVR